MKKRIYFIILIIFFLFFGLLPNVGRPFRSATKKVLSWPIEKISNISSGIGNYFSMLFSVGSLHQENTELKAKNMELESQLVNRNEILAENQKLKEALGYHEQTRAINLLTVKVIGHSPVNAIKTLEIDSGSEDDVQVGQTVISNGFLVGKISAVEARTSTVYLITNVNSQVPVMLQKSRAKGLLRGGLSGLTIEKIPLDAEISEGEDVLTANIGGEIVDGIAVGKVSKVISQESEIFKKISILSPVEFDKLDILFVIK